MDFIKTILKPLLYQPLFNLLVFLVWLLPGDSLGWAIIILTILIRLIMLPSSAKMLRSQKKMAELKPEIDALREKYKDDQKAVMAKTMELYRQNKINPAAGCLPMIIQMIVLVILYRVLISGLTTARFDELLYAFTPRPETINSIFFGIHLNQPDRLVLPWLAGGLQFWQSWWMMRQQTTSNQKPTTDPQQIMIRQMTYIFPIITVLFAFQLPAALPLYWIVMTIFALIQQWWQGKFAGRNDVKVKVSKII